MRGSRNLAWILEALDRVQYHVTVYLAQVRDTLLGQSSLGRLQDSNFIVPAMTAESLGLPMISDAIERYASWAATFPIVAEPWDGDRLLTKTGLSGLDPITVYHWAQTAKAYVASFVPRLDEGARNYLARENTRDIIVQGDLIVAMPRATVINHSNVDSSFNGLLAPTLSLETRRRLFPNSKRSNLLPTGTLLQHLDVKPGWELGVRPRVKALGETIDAPRPVGFLTSEIFGIQSPDRTVVKTAMKDVLDITPAQTKDFLQAIAGSPPSLMFNSYKPKRFFPGFKSEALKPADQSKPTIQDVLKTVTPPLVKYGLLGLPSLESDGDNSSKDDPVAAFRRRFATPLSTDELSIKPLFGVDAGFASKAPKPADQSKPATPRVSKAVTPGLAKHAWLGLPSLESNGETSEADPIAAFRRKLSRHGLPKLPLDQSEPVEKVKLPEPGTPSWANFDLHGSTSAFFAREIF